MCIPFAAALVRQLSLFEGARCLMLVLRIKGDGSDLICRDACRLLIKRLHKI